jgi:hypothetical protein
MPEQTYSERIRHPDGALNPPKQTKPMPWLFWFVVLAVAVLFGGSRAGWFRGGASPPSSFPANPHGWR